MAWATRKLALQLIAKG